MSNDDKQSNSGIAAQVRDAEGRAEASVSQATAAARIAEDLAREAALEAKTAMRETHATDVDLDAALRKTEQAADLARQALAAAIEARDDAAARASEAVHLLDDGDAAGAQVAADAAERAAKRAASAAEDAEDAAVRARDAELGAEQARLRVEKVGAAEAAIEKRPAMYLAEFATPEAIVHAAESVRDAGYAEWDVHTPYPIHGMDAAMGLGEPKIGWISMVSGMLGILTAVLMIQYMNNIDYGLVIGGKPPGAVPSMVPIMFELGILLTGFGTFFGMLHLTKLPRHHHPIFYSDRFRSATDDKFFISIEVADRQFDLERTKQLLDSLHPTHVELVEEEVA